MRCASPVASFEPVDEQEIRLIGAEIGRRTDLARTAVEIVGADTVVDAGVDGRRGAAQGIGISNTLSEQSAP